MAAKTNKLTKDENMSAVSETAEARKTRALIVNTAERHFKRYGYHKTTIVEIAADCAMSHANVYRFFRNKADVADAVGALWIEKLIAIADKASATDGTASERLVDVVLALYRAKKHEVLRTRHVHELFLQAALDGRSVAETYQRRVETIFARLIEDGITSREFATCDAEGVARVLDASLAKYFHPVLVEQYVDEDSEDEIRLLLRLVTRGLIHRPDESAPLRTGPLTHRAR